MQFFLNLPVRDLTRSTAFYEAIGAVRQPGFSDDTAACMRVSETFSVMLLIHDRFQGFSQRPIGDAQTSCAALYCLIVAERATIERMVDAAARNGGLAEPTPAQDHGFMAMKSLADPDGHIFEIGWMDPAAVPPHAG